MKKYISFLSIALVFFACNRNSPEPKYVWTDSIGEDRADYAMFRNEFNVRGKANCIINLFVDSRYHLFVNGEFVNFGPARFYPENPQYDSYDISHLLKDGKNVVAVKALSNGTYTYQVPLSKAGFIAWGEIKKAKRVMHDLATPGNWKCRSMEGYDQDAPKMSFATGPIEVYDARKDPKDWCLPDFDDATWETPVPIEDQQHWGTLTPRTIPALTQDKQPAAKLLGVYSVKQDEEIYSFRLKSDDRTPGEFNKSKYAFAYTYIYSPVKQTVRSGLWWGEYWMNGKGPLPNLGIEPGKPVRSDVMLDLEPGWNFFFIKYGIVWANWEFYMAVPKTASLVLSPTKEQEIPINFMTAGPFSDEEEELVRSLELPFHSPEDLPELSTGWKPKTRNDAAGNPAFEVAWSYFDKAIQQSDNPHGISIDNPDPVSLIFDLGHKTLGRFYIDIESKEGTTIDIAFSEDLKEGRPWILKRPGLYTALRFVANEGMNHFESFKPYGARYAQVNVSHHNAPFTINDIGMISQTYPFRKTGSFECSDTMLNAIWELGWRTLLVCSEDSYTDTPFRERGLYAGDALPEYAITLAGSGDSRLMQQCTFLYSQMYSDLMIPGADRSHLSVNHMADYPLLTLLSYVWSVNRTGDPSYAEKYYDGYKNMLEILAGMRMENGLIEHNRAFVEWTQIDKDATLTAIQSLAAYCFHSMAWLSDLLGKNDSDWFLDQENLTLAAMHTLCWDNEKGAFRDGFRDGEAIDHHYPISSIWPSLFGQTSTEQESRLEGFYATSLADIGSVDRQRLATPYGGFYIIDGLYRMGYTETAEKFMKKYWSPMIIKYNDTAWENFGDGADGSGQGTLSHAWSGGPTYNMTRHILGVDLGFPDFSPVDRIVFEPQAWSITWAKGTVPHKYGNIEIEWHLDGEKLYFNCKVPEGVEWKVNPLGILADKELWVNNALQND